MNYLQKELYELIQTDPKIFEFLQQGTLDGIWYWDLEKKENEWMSPRFWELLGYDPSEKQHLAKEWQNLIDPDDLKVALENFNKHLKDPKHPYDQIVRYSHKDGSSVWVRCRGIAIRDAAGRPIRMLGAHNDVSQMKKQEEIIKEQNEQLVSAHAKLMELSVTDELTQLYNRRFFQDKFEYLIKSAVRHNQPISLVIMDIDHFKDFNDSFGHAEGDQVLKTIGEILTRNARETDVVARIGGEEFAVVLPNTGKHDSIIACQRIEKSIKDNPWPLRKVTISFGIASLHKKRKTQTKLWELLFREADDALYYSKRQGRYQLNHFDDMK
jgi:diguanylate cyclase (GGDEF)-like protein/PAS domain S-box-containing protein